MIRHKKKRKNAKKLEQTTLINFNLECPVVKYSAETFKLNFVIIPFYYPKLFKLLKIISDLLYTRQTIKILNKYFEISDNQTKIKKITNGKLKSLFSKRTYSNEILTLLIT